VKFGFVAKHRGTWPVVMICDMLSVPRSGFYACRTRPESRRAQTDTALGIAMRASFASSDRTYGARRIRRELRERGFAVGLHHVERVMRANALRARPRRRGLPPDTGERWTHAIAPNLLDRDFTATAPNRKWVADFTCLWTAEGWLFVAVVLDLFSRRVVGWSMPGDDGGVGDGPAADGRVATRHAAQRSRPLGPGQSVHQRQLSTHPPGMRYRVQHESLGQRLGQCRHGELLLHAEDGADSPPALRNSRRGPRGRL